jgi:hypothetical protein
MTRGEFAQLLSDFTHSAESGDGACFAAKTERDVNQQQRVVEQDGEHRETAVTYQHILYEVSDKIATITLHRPDRMNAWTPIMERDVRHAMEAAAADDDVRVIVLTGSGRAFCAGADMDALKGLDPNDIRRAETGVPPFDMNRRPDW